MKLAFLFVLLASCYLQSLSAADPCVLPPRQGTGNWYGNVTTIKNCFRNTPFSATRVADTITRLRQLVDLYAFTDISKDSGAPWNMQVDLDAGLSAIAVKAYANDYDFHADLASLFSELNDAHTLYTFPSPYSNAVVVRPFSLQVVNDNGILKFYLAPPSLISSGAFKILTGFDSAAYYGRELTAIDGTPINQWFKNFTDKHVGLYKDPSVRFNAAIQQYGTFTLYNGAFLSVMDLSDYWSMTVNGTEVQVPYLAVLGQGGVNSTSYVMSLVDTPLTSKKRFANAKELLPAQPDIHRERMEQLSWLKPTNNDDSRYNTKRFDYSTLNTQVQKRSDLQTDRYILSVKSGNATNLQIIARTNDDSLWWGFYTTNAGEVIPYLRVVSFAPVDAANYTAVLTSFANYISANQTDRIIVDASGNGGGDLCLAYETLQIFSQQFRGLSGFEMSDLRRTQTNIDLQQAQLLTGYSYRRTSNGEVYGPDNSWFNARTVTRGGQSSQLTQQVFFPASCLDSMDNIPQTHFPADPIIVTDGTCGSSCALFVSKFVEHGVGRVFTYGGIPDGSKLETCSFPGGNVWKWSEFVAATATVTLPDQPQYSPTSAGFSFTHHELYIGTTSELPREFRSLTAPYHAYYYDYLTSAGSSSPSGQQAIATLYETAVTAWTLAKPVPPVAVPVTVAAPVAAAVPTTAPKAVVSTAAFASRMEVLVVLLAVVCSWAI